MSLVVDEHRQYLADRARVSAFEQAIAEVVNRGDVVVDLGAGTGILGLLACRAGAARVYSIESEGTIELARQICRANGFADRVTFLQGFSTRVVLPERADVVVTDQIGRFGFEAGLLEYLADARARFLKPAGRTIPSSVEMCMAPVESAELRGQIEFWQGAPAGFNYAPARFVAVNTGYPWKFQAENLLARPAAPARLDLSQQAPRTLKLTAAFAAERSGQLDGVAGWFSAQLSPSVSMTNSPLAPNAINRRSVFFPAEQHVQVAPGDRISVEMSILPKEIMVQWKVAVWDAAQANGAPPRASSTHSTFQGMLVAREHMLRTKPDFVPQLTPWGQARQSVLELCDGKRPLKEIEQEVYRRHAQLFQSPGEAAGFVAEVITVYSL